MEHARINRYRKNLNGHGKGNQGVTKVNGEWGFGKQSEARVKCLDFAKAYDLAITNTFFRKREVHIIT